MDMTHTLHLMIFYYVYEDQFYLRVCHVEVV